eukprot:4329314-Alexandrium_andersonii.AAC.1
MLRAVAGPATVRTLGPRWAPRLLIRRLSEARSVHDLSVVHLDSGRGVSPIRGLCGEPLELRLARQRGFGEVVDRSALPQPLSHGRRQAPALA